MAGQRRRPRLPRRDPRLHGARGRGARHRGQASRGGSWRTPIERAAFLASDEFAAAKKLLFAFRLWCVVELHAALEAGIPVVIRAGKAAREGDAVKFDTEGAVDMLNNLAYMIDVERAECAVRADYDREMDAVRNGEGVETVNKRVAGAVIGGGVSADTQDLAVDAAACGELEALRALPRDAAVAARSTPRRRAGGPRRWRRWSRAASSTWRRSRYPLWIAAAGGHREVVAALIAAGANVDLAARLARRGHAAVRGGGANGHHEVVRRLSPRARRRPGGNDEPRR